MPVQSCRADGRPGYKWGNNGKCYTYPSGNDRARREAKRKAIIQGIAAGERPTAATLNAELAVGLAEAEHEHLDKFPRVYEKALRSLSATALAKFSLTAAAEWHIPAEGSLITAATIRKVAESVNVELEPARLAVILDTANSALAAVESSWDEEDPVPQRLLRNSARRTGQSLQEAAQFILRETLQQAWDEGLSVRDTSRLIQERMVDAAPYQADMLARTDLNMLGNGSSKEAAVEAGMGYKTWLATLDDKTRPEHADAHGQTVPINDTFLVGGEECDYPCDPILSDAMACNCRCSVSFGETLEEAESLLADAEVIIMGGMATKEQRRRKYERRAAHAKSRVVPPKDEALVAGAVAVHHTAVVAGTWDGNAAMTRAKGAADYRAICAWFESGADLDQRQSWKFPHHANAGGPASVNGVRIGLARIPRASIPSGDDAGVEAHLRAHLNDFNRRQGNQAIEDFDSLTTEEALAAMETLLGPVDAVMEADKDTLAPKLPPGMTETPPGVGYCTMGGNPGYTGGRACHVHDGSPGGMRGAMRKAQADAKNKGKAAVIASARPIAFNGTAVIEGRVSDDNTLTPRVILPDSLTWQEMPLPFMAQTKTADGHDGAEVAGRVDEFARKRSTGKLRDIKFAGELTNEFGINEIAPMIEDKTLRYVSADLGATEWAIVNRQTFDVVPQEDLNVDDLQAGAYALACTAGKFKAVTLVPTQAIEGAMISLTAAASGQEIGIEALSTDEVAALVASGGRWTPDPERTFRVVMTTDELELHQKAITASAAKWRPPRDWFDMPELPGKMPLTVTKDGRVYGHLATWDSCHVSFLPSCVPPPKSASNYAYFHVSEVDTEEGDTITVGKLMFSPTDGGHADRRLTAQKASQYYDRTGMIAAVLRVSDGQYGIWAAGSLNPMLTPEQREEMRCELRLNPPSGDWRPINGEYELICGLAVAVPGFPVPRAIMSVVASADGLEIKDALIASSGRFDADAQALYAAEQMGIADEDALAESKMRVLAARAEGMDALAALVE